jgi:hypothetical protein
MQISLEDLMYLHSTNYPDFSDVTCQDHDKISDPSLLSYVSTRAACSPQVSFLQLGLRRERTLRPSPESRWSFYRSLENV